MRMGEDRDIPESSCPNCGKLLDAATIITDDKTSTKEQPVKQAPEPGDITVCIACGHVMAFADDMSIRPLTDTEMFAVAGDERLLALQWARGKVFNKVKP